MADTQNVTLWVELVRGHSWWQRVAVGRVLKRFPPRHRRGEYGPLVKVTLVVPRDLFPDPETELAHVHLEVPGLSRDVSGSAHAEVVDGDE